MAVKKNSLGLRKAHTDGKMKYDQLMGNRGWAKGKNALTDHRIGRAIEDIFCDESDMATGYLKKLIIDNKLKDYKCDKCRQNDIWNNEALVFDLDHINGKRSDNRLENLRFLCPNCHSQTPTFKGRNVKQRRAVSDMELVAAMRQSKNIRQSLIKVGMDPKGANYNRVHYLKGKYNIMFRN